MPRPLGSPPRFARIPLLSVSALIGCMLLAAGAGTAEGRERRVVSRAADIDVATMLKLTQRGEVALIESGAEGESRQVVMFATIGAPPERVWDAIMEVEAYPNFLRTVESIKVLKRAGSMLAFAWQLDLPFVDLQGARMQRGRRPTLIEVKGTSGNLRGSKERWELSALDGGERTLVTFYRALDVETGGLILQALVKIEPSMEQGANLSTSFVHIQELRRHLEGLPKPEIHPSTAPVPPFRSLALTSGDIDLGRLGKLLRHGQLALIESNPDSSLKQVALFAEVDAPAEKLQQIVRDPDRYPEFIPNFAEQKATPVGDGKLRLEWELEIPLKNLEGTSLMTIEEGGAVDVIAVSGDITRGRWRWEFAASGSKTIPIHYAYTDLRDASWVTRKIIEKQPLFEHGMVLASATVALTAMKERAEGRR